MERDITYHLGKHGHFYGELASITNGLVRLGCKVFKPELYGYQLYMKNNLLEENQSKREYLIDFIMAGVLWNCYSHHAGAFNKWLKPVFTLMISSRERNGYIKKAVDKMRGLMTGILLDKKHSHEPEVNLTNFSLLIDWLESTGDYSRDAERLKLFKRYLVSLPRGKRNGLLYKCIQAGWFFAKACKKRLGKYTPGVEAFRETHRAIDKHREDRVFRQKHEVEYHLNMVAAEILNKSFRNEFDSRDKRMVLLPTCTRSNSQCKALTINGMITCTTCNNSCNAGKITQWLRERGDDSILVPHSTGFSHLLKKWKDDKNTALVGVACVLNLIEGGYAMKKLGIASQCVFLDYSGCKKHWHEKGIPTNLNMEQLEVITAKRESTASCLGC